jgi:tetratricopeptide (TPR) repeat protein
MASAETVALEPAAVNVAAVEPVPLEPADVEAEALDQVTVDPVDVEPVPIEPAGRETALIEPVVLEPVTVEPVSVEPAVAPTPEIVPAADPFSGRGFALVEAGRFGEALTLGRQSLAALKSGETLVPTSGVTQETARLWGLVGLAQQGLGEVDDARFAFEEAIAQAPGSERPTWERHLAALALAVGRRTLADRETESAGDRAASLESTIEWLDRGLAVAPDDAELGETRTRVQEAIWDTHEATITEFVGGREFGEARRLLDVVLSDPECPAERRRALGRLLARSLGGQARQATADALRHRLGGREEEALAALSRAEDLLTPLFRAWSVTGDDERGRQARALLVEALEDIVDARVEDIDRMIDAGDTSLALIHGEKLWILIRGALDHGLSREDLAGAFTRMRVLFDRLHADHPAES